MGSAHILKMLSNEQKITVLLCGMAPENRHLAVEVQQRDAKTCIHSFFS